MILSITFEATEKMTTIGFAKAIIDSDCFKPSDLEELGNYLLIYSNSRAKESLEQACTEMKGDAE